MSGLDIEYWVNLANDIPDILKHMVKRPDDRLSKLKNAVKLHDNIIKAAVKDGDGQIFTEHYKLKELTEKVIEHLKQK